MPDTVELVQNSESVGAEDLGIQHSTNPDETLERKDYSQKERDQMDDSDFGDPENQAFPIKTAQDVINAASRLHNASGDQGAIKARIERIAKKKGFPLPQTWQDEDKGSDGKDEKQQERALPDGILALDGYNPHMTLPIVRKDAESWMVYGRATVEEPDHHGTIFSYEGAKNAFARWKGNIREQHDIKKAVGKRVDYEFNDEEKGVYLTARVSRGAPDTWQKVMDDVLCDFSVNVIPSVEYGNDPRRWPKKEFNGKMYPYLPEYDYAEISLVDSGSAPGAQFTPIVRADGSATELLEVLEEPEPEVQPPTLERAGATLSAATKGKMHNSIGHTLHAAVSQMQNCGCEDCQAALKLIDPDDDGDIDLGGYDDPDNDWQSLYGDQSSQDMERTVIGIVERAIQPVYIRLQGIAGMLAKSNAVATKPNTTTLETIVSGAITRAVEAATAANASNLDEVRASLGAVKGQVDAIANTPMPGAPVMNTNAIPPQSQPVDKQLTTDPYARPERSGSSVYDAVAAMAQSGQLDTTEKQVDAVARALAAQRHGR
jgi:hypothetical protein